MSHSGKEYHVVNSGVRLHSKLLRNYFAWRKNFQDCIIVQVWHSYCSLHLPRFTVTDEQTEQLGKVCGLARDHEQRTMSKFKVPDKESADKATVFVTKISAIQEKHYFSLEQQERCIESKTWPSKASACETVNSSEIREPELRALLRHCLLESITNGLPFSGPATKVHRTL